MHVRAALRIGLTPDEIKEVLLHERRLLRRPGRERGLRGGSARARRARALGLMRTQVAIVGAGPAGLTLARLLERGHRVRRARGPEPRLRRAPDPRRRARAGYDRSARGGGGGERMQREGIVHHGIELQFDGERHRIPLSELTGGRTIMIYGQTEVVKDLIGSRLDAGLPLLFEVSGRQRSRGSSRPGRRSASVTKGRPRARCDVIAGCDGLSRGVSAEHSGRRPARELARLSLRLARDPRGRCTVERRARVRALDARLRPVEPAQSRAEPTLHPVPPRRGPRRMVRRPHLGGAAAAAGARGLDARGRAGARERRDGDAELRRRADELRPPVPRRRRRAHRPAHGCEGPQPRAPRRESSSRRRSSPGTGLAGPTCWTPTRTRACGASGVPSTSRGG